MLVAHLKAIDRTCPRIFSIFISFVSINNFFIIYFLFFSRNILKIFDKRKKVRVRGQKFIRTWSE